MRCQNRVLLVTAERSDALLYLVMHLQKVHGVSGSVVLQGTDFTIGPAPHRCDLCCGIAEPPWWVYTTGPAANAEDPEWLVCDICHGIITGQPKPLRALVDRAFLTQTATLILDNLSAIELRAHVKGMIRMMLDNRVGEPRRE